MTDLRKPPRFAPLIIIGTTCFFGFPLLWMILSSLKPAAQLAADPYGIWPHRWAWENYRSATSSMPFWRYATNSLVLCGGSVVGTLFSCSLVAYGFARLEWWGRRFWFGILLATMLLPWHVTMIPRFLLLRQVGLYNSLAALIVPTFLGNAFYIFLLRQFFLSIPEELRDAARIDGLHEWGIWWRIFLPLSAPALITVSLLQAAVAWNDLSGPLLYLNDPRKFPLAYGLEQFISAYSDQTDLLLAAAVLFMLPMLVFFLLAQPFLMGRARSGWK